MIKPEKPKLLLSSAYFPPLEYFCYLLHAESAFIDIHETYTRQTWRNRCAIYSGNGPVNLSIPVERPLGNNTPTRDVLTSQHQNWQKAHWRSIESAYRNAPFFLYYGSQVEELIMGTSSSTKLIELNNLILTTLCLEMNLDVMVSFTDNFLSDTQGYLDMRFAISPKSKDRKHITDLPFKPYYQVFDERYSFQPNLSILDLLFNLGPDAKKYLMQTIPS